MIKGFRMIAATMLAGVTLMSSPVMAAEQNVVIDGAFTDWATVDGTDISDSSTWFESAEVAYDDKYAYIHIVEKESNQWETRYPWLMLTSGDSSKMIRFGRTDYLGLDGFHDIVVGNSWNQGIYGAEGKMYRSNGVNEWEVAIPLQTIFVNEDSEITDAVNAVAITDLSASWTDGGEVVVEGVSLLEDNSTGDEPSGDEPSGDEPSGDTPSGDEPGGDTPSGDVPAGDGIVIDGYYDDWENMPITLITYGSWNHTGEYILEYHEGKMIIDNDRLCISIKMCETYDHQIPLDVLNITIDGQQQSFCIRKVYPDGSINWDEEVYNLSDGIHTDLAFFPMSGAKTSIGDVAVTIVPGHDGNEFEVAVDLEKLLEFYDIDADTVKNGARIEFFSPNIGPEKLVIVGTPTGPIIGIILCAGCAVAGLMMSRKSGRKQNA